MFGDWVFKGVPRDRDPERKSLEDPYLDFRCGSVLLVQLAAALFKGVPRDRDPERKPGATGSGIAFFRRIEFGGRPF